VTWRLRAILITIAAIAAAAAGYLVFRPRLSDRDKIVATLLEAAGAVERKDVGETMKCVSDDYHDAAGLSKRVLRILALHAKDIEGSLRVTMGVTGVTINDDRAEALADVCVRVSDSSGTHVLFDGPLSFALRKEKRGRWRVTDSEGWQQALDIEQGF